MLEGIQMMYIVIYYILLNICIAFRKRQLPLYDAFFHVNIYNRLQH